MTYEDWRRVRSPSKASRTQDHRQAIQYVNEQLDKSLQSKEQQE
jgi:hypothetical protein